MFANGQALSPQQQRQMEVRQQQAHYQQHGHLIELPPVGVPLQPPPQPQVPPPQRIVLGQPAGPVFVQPVFVQQGPAGVPMPIQRQASLYQDGGSGPNTYSAIPPIQTLGFIPQLNYAQPIMNQGYAASPAPATNLYQPHIMAGRPGTNPNNNVDNYTANPGLQPMHAPGHFVAQPAFAQVQLQPAFPQPMRAGGPGYPGNRPVGIVMGQVQQPGVIMHQPFIQQQQLQPQPQQQQLVYPALARPQSGVALLPSPPRY